MLGLVCAPVLADQTDTLIAPSGVEESGSGPYSPCVGPICLQNFTPVVSIVHLAGGSLLRQPEQVKVAGKYAYIASLQSNALEIVDVSNRLHPFTRHAFRIILVGQFSTW